MEELRELLTRKRDELLRAVRGVLLASDPDPFALSFAQFAALGEEAQIAAVHRAWALREEWLEAELIRRRACWLVVAGEDVVASGDDLETIPVDEALDELGRRFDRAPLLFTRPLVEEAVPPRTPWAELAAGDAYPTVSIHLGAPGDLEAVFERAPFVADLDTGSPALIMPSEHGESIGWRVLARRWRAARHLGQDYEWRPVLASVGVVDRAGTRRSADVTAIAVRRWAEGPFTRVNPARRALVGRNVLMRLGLRVLLLAGDRQTSIEP
jgi:hypothetical protein